MGSPAVLLPSRARAVATPLRLLQAWHLLSLDAPTVAFCWMLLFGTATRMQHELPAAAALSCAVWLIYAADRVLDARREPAAAAWAGASRPPLASLYGEHARSFVVVGLVVAAGMIAPLSLLPRAVVEAWLLLAGPLALYAAAVHWLRLGGRWKAVCVGVFFATAVALPLAVQGGLRWSLAAAALAFGGACRANCAVLRAPMRRLRVVLATSMVVSLLPLRYAETRAIALACLGSLLLLAALVRHRETASARLGPLSWRALVDMALVAPPLVVVAGVLLAA